METDLNSTQYVANKAFTVGGKRYSPGDPVNVDGLADHKVGQLLNQRYLRPAPFEPNINTA